MEILRTPDDRFENLDGFAFSPNYLNVPAGDPDQQQLRVHYVDEGPADQPPILLMHGEPTWSYLYRKMIPILIDAGHRVIAPDLVGFGRSDKPAEQSDYSYNRLVSWMEAALITELDLENITLFCQDWGGLIGLRLLAAHPDRFARVMAANTGMPLGNSTPPQAFLEWQMFSQAVPEFPTSIIVQGGCETALTPSELAAYEAPFPDETYKSGARILPTLVPTTPEDPAREAQIKAWKSLAAFDRPFLTAFSDKDAVTAGGEVVFQNKVAGAQGQKHVTIEGAGHFLQEDEPQQICDHLIALIEAG